MTTDVELLPCPFCGEEMLREFNGALFVHPDPDSSECPIRFQEGYTDEDATAWNRRANVVHATAAKDAEIEALRAEVAKAERSVEHTHQWYAVRLEKIKEVAKRVGLWSEISAIIANGSGSIYDPPTYAQQLNIAKHETKAAEARAERLAEALRDAAEALQVAGLPGNAKQFRSMLRDQEARNG